MVPIIPVALLAEGVDRNAISLSSPPQLVMSPSSRRAWIEIRQRRGLHHRPQVALLAEGVDRNESHTSKIFLSLVALLAEGVDRNIDAAIKEMDEVASPSSRRAWIEI